MQQEGRSCRAPESPEPQPSPAAPEWIWESRSWCCSDLYSNHPAQESLRIRNMQKSCNCIAFALPALKTQPPVMLSVLENPKTTAHEEQRSRRDELKEILSLTHLWGWGSRRGTELHLGRISSTSHHPSPIQTTGIWECPLQGPPGSVIPRKSKLHPLWGSRETCCLQSLLNSSGLIVLLVHF